MLGKNGDKIRMSTTESLDSRELKRAKKGSADAKLDNNPTQKDKLGEGPLPLTDQAKRLKRLEQVLISDPYVVDHKRVNEIKQAIADEKYQINSKNVASKLFSLEKQLD